MAALGVDRAQGYLISRALPAAAVLPCTASGVPDTRSCRT